MRTTIDSYLERATRLDTRGIDFEAFADHPLSPGALRCLGYMHDVEFHTVCYLRDLLVTPAHRDPEITSFLACWVYEELWHGDAIRRVLEASGRTGGAARIGPLRTGRRWQALAETMTHLVGSGLAGSAFIALHMAWGAVNEWSTQAAYARLAAVEGHPVLGELLRRIMRQEGRHIDFYAAEATRRLSTSATARQLTRHALVRLWRPVGSGVMPPGEVRFLVEFLFSGPDGRSAAERVDRQIDRLPGLSGLRLLAGEVDRLVAPALVSA